MTTPSQKYNDSMILRLPVVLVAGFFLIGVAAGTHLMRTQVAVTDSMQHLIIYWGLLLITMSICVSALRVAEGMDMPVEETTHFPLDQQSDDFLLIEGIGPKFSEALKGAGIRTYAQLASMPESEIRACLKAAGYRSMPGLHTWREQARLASVGEWDRLKRLQDKLNGSRDDI